MGGGVGCEPSQEPLARLLAVGDGGNCVRRDYGYPHYPHPVVSPIVVVRPPVVVRPVVVVNPPACVPTSICIVNPATTGVTLSYSLNGQQFALQPGSMEEVGTASVIEFDRGNGQGIARYTLDGGTYTFTAGSNGGWDLVRTLG